MTLDWTKTFDVHSTVPYRTDTSEEYIQGDSSAGHMEGHIVGIDCGSVGAPL